MKKKGLSPIIATVLLIAIVMVLAAIIFLWARGFISEKVAKFGEPVERSCEKTYFEAGIFPQGVNYVLEINNRGEIPLYGFDVKVLGRGSVIVNEYSDKTVGLGESFSIDIDKDDLNGESNLLVVPIILGQSDNGKVAFTCDDQYGVPISVS